MGKSSITYKFLDDPTERKQKSLEKQRKKQQEYRDTHKQEISRKQKIKSEQEKKERKKGNRKRWNELTKQEPKIKQIDIRHFQNLSNNNTGELIEDANGWYYVLKYGDNREYYKSDYFKTKVKAVKDLKLAL